MTGEEPMVADEFHMKKCSNCGKDLVKPVFYKGYVFCSTECKDAFVPKLAQNR